jgi:hypothetical protein
MKGNILMVHFFKLRQGMRPLGPAAVGGEKGPGEGTGHPQPHNQHIQIHLG